MKCSPLFEKKKEKKKKKSFQSFLSSFFPKKRNLIHPLNFFIVSRKNTLLSTFCCYKNAIIVPFQQFQALFTLFSKFFSSFAHATCLLSVSGQYLALGEIYLPFWATIPSNPTLEKH